jgi:hypothetical protein
VANPPACGQNNINSTFFKTMSIVDQPAQNDATFSYPHTAVNGWLCSDNSHITNQSCNINNPNQNNSAAQGYLFYQKVHAATPATPLQVYRVDSCQGPIGEGVDGGRIPALNCLMGHDEIVSDMVSNCTTH